MDGFVWFLPYFPIQKPQLSQTFSKYSWEHSCVQHLIGAVGVEASELSPEPSRNLQSVELKKESEIKMITGNVPGTMVWKLLDFCPPLFLIWSHVVSFQLPSNPGLLFQVTGVAWQEGAITLKPDYLEWQPWLLYFWVMFPNLWTWVSLLLINTHLLICWVDGQKLALVFCLSSEAGLVQES